MAFKKAIEKNKGDPNFTVHFYAFLIIKTNIEMSNKIIYRNKLQVFFKPLFSSCTLMLSYNSDYRVYIKK